MDNVIKNLETVSPALLLSMPQLDRQRIALRQRIAADSAVPAGHPPTDR